MSAFHCQGPPVTRLPIYWFAVLEKAVERGDFVTAGKAQRKLERLGVRVAYRRRPFQRRERMVCQK